MVFDLRRDEGEKTINAFDARGVKNWQRTLICGERERNARIWVVTKRFYLLTFSLMILGTESSTFKYF